MSVPRSAAEHSIPLATIWVLGAVIGWATMAVVVRYLEGRVPSWDLSFYRALAALLVGVGPMLWQKGRSFASLMPRKGLFLSYLMRGLVIFTAQALFYYALMHMPLADASVLNATVPIFSAVLAIIFLRERVGADRWLFILLGFAGVIAIIRPGYRSVPIEALFALGSALFFALSSILNKQLVKIESGASIVYGTNFFVALCGLVVVLFWGVLPSWRDLGIVALIGITGAGAQYCMSRALVHGDVSYVSPFEFMRVPMIALAAWMLFDQVPPLMFYPGAAMIFLAVMLLARRAARLRIGAVPRPVA